MILSYLTLLRQGKCSISVERQWATLVKTADCVQSALAFTIKQTTTYNTLMWILHKFVKC